MIDYACITPGRGFDARRACLYYLQRLVVFHRIRRLIAWVVACCVKARQSSKFVPQRDVSDQTDTVVRLLRNDGLAILSPLLSPQQIAQMLEYLADKRLAFKDGSRIDPASMPSDKTSADYPLETVLQCPHVLTLANHPLPLAVAHRYIGCAPTISTIGIRWSFPGNAKGTMTQGTMTQGFHRDPDDWRFVKLFVHLTDIDAAHGPHVYVAGSHRTNGTIFARSYPTDELLRTFGPTRLCTVTGAAGTTFMADTYGIHKGGVPEAGARLMLEVGYSILPVFSLHYRPVGLDDMRSIDPHINRLIVAPLNAQQ
jgi:phytanoyl-CoA dioxygenase PhyH